MKTSPHIVLSVEELATLKLWSCLTVQPRLALRARIILLAADGRSNKEIAKQLHASTKTVSMWRRRFHTGRLAAVEKAAPRGRPQAEINEAVVRLVLQKTHDGPGHTGRWTTRSLAKELGVSPSLIQRVWKAHGLTPNQ